MPNCKNIRMSRAIKDAWLLLTWKDSFVRNVKALIPVYVRVVTMEKTLDASSILFSRDYFLYTFLSSFPPGNCMKMNMMKVLKEVK